MKTAEPFILLNDGHGVYIPQLWAADLEKDEASLYGISAWALETCQAGPDSEHYWDAWTEILDDASFIDDAGQTWFLHQNGDLWAVPEGFEFPEEF